MYPNYYARPNVKKKCINHTIAIFIRKYDFIEPYINCLDLFFILLILLRCNNLAYYNTFYLAKEFYLSSISWM